ncbi:MAG TPA: hypothetical protein VK572_14390 [Burkholderiales bacterium]|nr:hypothetical protein [Burkholderiales bacterium]
MKTLPVSVSLVSVSLVFVSLASLAFAVDGFAQTAPAQGPIQVAQTVGGASQGASLPAAAGGPTSTIMAVIAVGAAAAVAVATSNSTVSTNH